MTDYAKDYSINWNVYFTGDSKGRNLQTQSSLALGNTDKVEKVGRGRENWEVVLSLWSA